MNLIPVCILAFLALGPPPFGPIGFFGLIICGLLTLFYGAEDEIVKQRTYKAVDIRQSIRYAKLKNANEEMLTSFLNCTPEKANYTLANYYGSSPYCNSCNKQTSNINTRHTDMFYRPQSSVHTIGHYINATNVGMEDLIVLSPEQNTTYKQIKAIFSSTGCVGPTSPIPDPISTPTTKPKCEEPEVKL